jgi:hypothetical protein
MRLTIETRLEQAIALAAAVLIVTGTALVSPPAALVVGGCFLLASLIDLRRTRP